MRAFRIGDRVLLIGGSFVGQETTVMSDLRPKIGNVNSGSCPAGTPVHQIDLPPTHSGCSWTCATPQNMKLIYDGHEPCSWEDCVWQPDICTV